MGKRICTSGAPITVMVAVEVVFAVVSVLMKKCLDEGMNALVFVAYRFAVAAVFLLPVAYFAERGIRPKLTILVAFYLFLCATIGGTLTQFFLVLGLEYTSPMFYCAFVNMVPVATFALALPFRMEKADMRTFSGRAKAFGTLLSVAGAMVLTFYDGPALTNPGKAMRSQRQHELHHTGKPHKWAIGSLFLSLGCLSWSSWYLLQAKLNKVYPIYSTNAVVALITTLQSGVIAIIAGRNWSSWILKGNLEIITIVFSGFVAIGLGLLLMSWCIKKRGPIFTATFSPFMQVVVATIDLCILHENLHLGSILGSLLVIMGLYILLWGKSKEDKLINGGD